MSKIGKARGLILEALNRSKDAYRLQRESIDLLQIALKYMYREPQVRRALAKHVTVTPEIRHKVRRLARLYPNMTTVEIATRCGLRNSGRVSEILHNKR